MSGTRAGVIKAIFFLAVFILIDWVIEWTSLRPRSLTEAVDLISVETGLGSQLIDTLFVGVVAFLVFQIILVLTNSLQFLTGDRRREVRTPEEMTHEHGVADD